MSVQPTSPVTQPEFAALCAQAFREYGRLALWSGRPVPNPNPAGAMAITRSLRVDGILRARRLAELIEQACFGDLVGDAGVLWRDLP